MIVSIRSASPSDATAIGALAAQFANYLRDLGDETEFKLNAEAYRRDGFGDDPAFKGLVAEDDRGNVIGYLLYHFGYDTDAANRNLHVVDLYVGAGARKHGIGRALMGAAARIATKANAYELIWSVYRANDLAMWFYERLGAQQISDLTFMKVAASAL